MIIFCRHWKSEFTFSIFTFFFWILNKFFLIFFLSSEPNARRIVFNSENNFRKVENVFYHSLEPIFPTSVFPQLSSTGLIFKLIKNFVFFNGFFVLSFFLVNQGVYSNINYTKISTKRC